MRTRPGYDALWLWFGLSRASWLTMPRSMMHAMPDEWQARMAALCEEWDATWQNQPDITPHVSVRDGRGRIRKVPSFLSNYRHPDAKALDSMKATTNG